MAALSSCIVTRATIGMRMTLVTEQLLQDGGAPEYVYHNRIEGRCAVFVWAKVMAAKDIHKEMLPMYAQYCLSRQAVHNWVQRFSEGRTSIEDEHPVGRPVKEQCGRGSGSDRKNFTPHVSMDL